MTTVVVASDFGMPCIHCGGSIIAPEWAEFEDEQHVINLWSCTECGNNFETQAFVPSIAETIMRVFCPSSSLVARDREGAQHEATPLTLAVTLPVRPEAQSV